MSDPTSRYAAVSRRALLKGGAGLGAVALLPGLACGGGDQAVLAGARTSGRDTATQIPTTAAVETPTTVPSAAAPPTTVPATAEPATAAPTAEPATPAPVAATATEVPATTAPVSTLTALAPNTQAAIEFTYTQGSGGKNVPPYIAVWIEDAAGELIETVALWVQQRRGERWLPDLRRWYSVDQAIAGSSGTDVISSATRLPGSFSVMWDGTTYNGQVASAGNYFVCIESARERGPYSLIREPVTFRATPATIALGGQGELGSAVVTTRA